ncbi:MAG TPA: hypothetical protein VGE30_03145 [Candidatus Saccharimonadales bacterium]
MNFYDKSTNVAARASSGGERSRWRDEGVDPELVADPFDTLQAVRRAQAVAQEAARAQAHRPLSMEVAQQAMEHSNVTVSPALNAVQRSFGH